MKRCWSILLIFFVLQTSLPDRPAWAKSCVKHLYYSLLEQLPSFASEPLDFCTRDLVERLRNRSRLAPNGSLSKREIIRYLPDEAIVVEIGAHIGIDSLSLARKLPSAQLYAIEPIPNIFQQLSRNTARHPRIQSFPVAIGGENRSAVTMHVSSGWSTGSSSITPPKSHLLDYPQVRFDETVEVPMKKLETWMEEVGVPHIDLLWIDAQGAEFEILSSSTKALRSTRVIYVEVNFKETYEGTVHFERVESLLEEQGFRRIDLVRADAAQGNALFLNSRLLDPNTDFD